MTIVRNYAHAQGSCALADTPKRNGSFGLVVLVGGLLQGAQGDSRVRIAYWNCKNNARVACATLAFLTRTTPQALPRTMSLDRRSTPTKVMVVTSPPVSVTVTMLSAPLVSI